MPLSEHEQRLLSQLEQHLVADDPKFASTMRGAPRGFVGGRRLLIGVLGVVVGLALIVLAVAKSILLLAIPGFLLMLAGVSYALSRRGPRPPAAAEATGPAGPNRQARLFDRLEERWDRRRGERDTPPTG